MKIKFLRITHNRDGSPKEFPSSADHIWKLFGFVGHMLNNKIPLTLEEIYNNIINYNKENPSDSILEYQKPNSIVEALGELISEGLITTIVEPSLEEFEAMTKNYYPISFKNEHSNQNVTLKKNNTNNLKDNNKKPRPLYNISIKINGNLHEFEDE